MMMMDDELERIWKEVIMTYYEILFCHLFGYTAENHRKPGLRAGIQTRILPNTKQENHHHTYWFLWDRGIHWSRIKIYYK
jgi:hypothetical protein